MKLLLHSSSILLIVVASGCQSGRSVVVDQRPDYIPLEQIESTICIKVGIAQGSAVILDSTHLLTCIHVFGHEKTQEVSLFGICTSSGKFDQIKSDFHLVDEGEYDDEVEFTDLDSQWDLYKTGVDGDWALIKTDKPHWDAKNAAIIHPAAVDPEWVVPEGTELFLVGYSPIFMEETDEQSDTISDYDKRMLFIKHGPYTLCGRAITTDRGLGTVEHFEDWPAAVGHSGGGVYLWNADAERLELVGIFNTVAIGHYNFDFFGITKVNVGKRNFLLYSPIAPVLQALKSDKE